MSQLNIQMTAGFEEDLRLFMRVRGIGTKSEAVRVAVAEGLQAARCRQSTPDFTLWIGLARHGDESPEPRFRSDDDIW